MLIGLNKQVRNIKNSILIFYYIKECTIYEHFYQQEFKETSVTMFT